MKKLATSVALMTLTLAAPTLVFAADGDKKPAKEEKGKAEKGKKPEKKEETKKESGGGW